MAAKRISSNTILSSHVAGLPESRTKPPEMMDEEMAPQAFKVMIENVTTEEAPYHLAPGVFIVHSDGEPLFTEGEVDRGEGLEALAEDGNPGHLVGAIGATVFNTPDGSDMPGPLGPGDGMGPGNSYVFEFESGEGSYLSFASMLVQSNDLFFAPGAMGIALFEDGYPIEGDITEQIMLWDAGTEVNQEPGTGADQPMNQAAPNTGEDEGGPVRLVDDEFEYPETASVITVTITPVKGMMDDGMMDDEDGMMDDEDGMEDEGMAGEDDGKPPPPHPLVGTWVGKDTHQVPKPLRTLPIEVTLTLQAPDSVSVVARSMAEDDTAYPRGAVIFSARGLWQERDGALLFLWFERFHTLFDEDPDPVPQLTDVWWWPDVLLVRFTATRSLGVVES